jgi:hypothetical protein
MGRVGSAAVVAAPEPQSLPGCGHGNDQADDGVGPAAAARSFTRRPGRAIALATGLALVTVWAGIALSYRTNWPLGFYVGVIAAGFFLLGRGWTVVRRRWSASRPVPALAAVR